MHSCASLTELGQNPTDKEFFEVVSTVDREMKGVIGKTETKPRTTLIGLQKAKRVEGIIKF